MAMRKFLVMLLMLAGLAGGAKEHDVFVLPLYMTDAYNANVYGFETASEIIAGDIIQKFLLGTQINSIALSKVTALNSNDKDLKLVGESFRQTGVIDFEKLSSVLSKNLSESTLIVASYVVDKNGLKLDLWDVLKLAGDFDICAKPVLETKVILMDSKEGVALWQKTYLLQLASDKAPFIAKNYVDAVEQYEKLRSYSKNIIAKDVEEALNLRFSGKSIDYASRVKSTSGVQEGIGLKYYKKGGIPGANITKPKETFEEQLLKDDSFSL